MTKLLDRTTRAIANRNIGEITKAGYLMTNFGGQIGSIPVTDNLDVRYVDTAVTSRGLRGDFTVVNNGDGTIRLQSTGQFVPLTDRFEYRRWLPSLNTAFNVTDQFKLRLAVSRSMAKPDPVALANGRSFDTTTAFTSVVAAVVSVTAAGNQYNRPLMSWNYDASFEYYVAPR